MLRTILLGALLVLALAAAVATAPAPAAVQLQEYTIDPQGLCQIRDEWLAQLHAEYPDGGWVPMKVDLTDSMLAKMGLPSRDWMLSHRFPTPTLVMPDGSTQPVDLAVSTAGAASFAGAGCLGIRPGAWLLTVTADTIGWCSMAHVYG